MPFQKGNKLWQKGLETKKENRQRIQAFIATLANGGMERYAEIMDSLADGNKLSDSEKEYLDRIDGWREFVLPKLARQQIEGPGGGPIRQEITLDNEQAANLAAAAAIFASRTRKE